MIVTTIKHTVNPDPTNPCRATATYGGSLLTAVGPDWPTAETNIMALLNAIDLGTATPTTEDLVLPPE